MELRDMITEIFIIFAGGDPRKGIQNLVHKITEFLPDHDYGLWFLREYIFFSICLLQGAYRF